MFKTISRTTIKVWLLHIIKAIMYNHRIYSNNAKCHIFIERLDRQLSAKQCTTCALSFSDEQQEKSRISVAVHAKQIVVL